MSPREIYHRLAKKKFRDSSLEELRSNYREIDLKTEEYNKLQGSVRNDLLLMENDIRMRHRPVAIELSLLRQAREMTDNRLRELERLYSPTIRELRERDREFKRRYEEITKPIIERYDRYTRQLQLERFRRNLPPNRRLPIVHVPDLSEEDLDRLETLIEQSKEEIIPLSEFKSIVNLPDLQVYDLVDDGSDRYRYLVVSHDSVLYYPHGEELIIPIRFYPTILNLETVEDFEVLYPTDKFGTFASIQVIDNNGEELEVFNPDNPDFNQQLYVPPGFDSENQYKEFLRLVF